MWIAPQQRQIRSTREESHSTLLLLLYIILTTTLPFTTTNNSDLLERVSSLQLLKALLYPIVVFWGPCITHTRTQTICPFRIIWKVDLHMRDNTHANQVVIVTPSSATGLAGDDPATTFITPLCWVNNGATIHILNDTYIPTQHAAWRLTIWVIMRWCVIVSRKRIGKPKDARPCIATQFDGFQERANRGGFSQINYFWLKLTARELIAPPFETVAGKLGAWLLVVVWAYVEIGFIRPVI